MVVLNIGFSCVREKSGNFKFTRSGNSEVGQENFEYLSIIVSPL